MKAFTLFKDNNPFMIDLMLYHPFNFWEFYERKNIISNPNGKIYVVSTKDLIEMKKLSGREKDLFDIQNLENLLKVSDITL